MVGDRHGGAIADIDDNIIARVAEEGSSELELASRYEEVYVDQMRRLGVADPDHRPQE